MKRETADYVIVGAGSAGCVLARRLTEDPKARVLLLEAGGRDRSIVIRMPAACAIAARDRRFDWAYETEPEPQCLNRRMLEHRGKTLGGSSSINGMVANRGARIDYDGWAARGLPEWSYAHCLPYFKKLETSDKGPSQWRGGDGPQSIETTPARHALYQAFLGAGDQAGYPITEDQNGARHDGFHVAQSFTRRGRRWSAADGHLRPALRRANLDVRLHAHAHRVLMDGRRAVGVEYMRRGVLERVDAEREVILCAGAINSPQILQVSGIGDPDHLAQHGVAMVASLPGVGRGLEDHPIVPIIYATPRGVSVSSKLTRLGQARLGLEWLLFRTGLGASTMCEAGAFFRSEESIGYPDLQHEFYALTAEMGSPEANFDDGFMFSMGLMRPASKGSVTLASADPSAPPRIFFNYYAAEADRRAMIEGVRRTREMARQKAFDGLRTHEIAPGEAVRSDAEIMDWIRSATSTEYHPCSSCRMGEDDGAVTDAEGRVHGVDALRVVDASIMPSNVTANLNAPVLMIAEKLADAISGRAPLPAEAIE